MQTDSFCVRLSADSGMGYGSLLSLVGVASFDIEDHHG